MSTIRTCGAAVAAAIVLSSAVRPALAAATDYRFELAGKAAASGGKDLVNIRLVHLTDGKPITDAVIFESKADMGPAGMASMGAPVSAMPARGGVYRFEVEPGMTGTWAVHLAAKVQGEPETVRGTLEIDLVK